MRNAIFEMVSLADSGEFRRIPARRSALSPDVNPLIDRLVEARVLVSDTVDGVQVFELAHESLLRDWDLLVQWLTEYRGFFEWRQRFRAAVAEFNRDGAVLPPWAQSKKRSIGENKDLRLLALLN